ncbi:GAF domain-containing protein [Sodalinema gerasimenkoae]|uniref:GAF domain-containing protein n=1 Tax=Sodalinema gerasimenkoae TaxID=2862348 RepID=UPI001FED0101|nr:GAF domain-containing protein [Sodalinema gerasimenkoae]
MLNQLIQAIFSPSQSYIPHGHCYLWQTPLVALHVTSDALIALAYFSIPTLLIYFVLQRRDVPFLNVFYLFGAFIVLCGVGHLMDIWTLWHPAYWLAGVERAITALISCYTAASMVTLLPQFLSLKTPEQLEMLNSALQQEVEQRRQIEEELRQANQTLEARVQERTAALQASTQALIESQAQLQEAQGIAHIGSIDYDLENRELRASEEMKRIYHLTDPERPPTLKDFLKSIHPSDRSRWWQAQQNLLHQGHAIHLEHRLLLADGEIRYLDIKGEPRYNASGELVKLYGVALDITEQKLAKLQLEQQVQRSQLVAKTLERVWSSLNFQEVIQVIVEEVRQFLQVERVVIYRFQPDWSGDVIVESVSDPDLAILGEHFEDECFRKDYVQKYQQGRIRKVENVATSTLPDCHKALLSDIQVQANLVLPLLWHPSSFDETPELWGLLIAHSCQDTRPWHDSELEVLQQLTVQLGIALRQHNLIESLQNELEERSRIEAALRNSEAAERQKAETLHNTLQTLQQTQAKLVQSEKMASLGQMVGGLAHEINNPISFIYGNINHAREYSEQLLELIGLYQTYYPETHEPITDLLEALDLDFVRDDFPQLLDSMATGADRIRDIVLSLRNFSCLHEADWKVVDINASLDSTLTMIHARLSQAASRSSIDVVTQLGELPPIACYPGQLNQALFNILNNAIDALEERLRQEPSFKPQLQVRSELRSSHEGTDEIGVEAIARIEIIDNGLGIPQNLVERVFDPFFTTKPIGKGTGLGLSNAYQILVEQHEGALYCEPNPPSGTRFVIELPARQFCCESQTPSHKSTVDAHSRP